MSCDGGRARALQPSARSTALPLIHPSLPSLRYTTYKATETCTGVVVYSRSDTRINSLVRRRRGALTACGTRREPIPGGSVAASMPPHGPATGKGTAPDSWSALI
ncbi:hypothetical protein XarjCFBP7653_21280 [Xanthomonas arboricola]|nr:hypothetical protein XarjCFBP7653_21280 [Xanthomonas arboricola]